MGSNEMVWRYCSLKQRNAAFMISSGTKIEDNAVVADESTECLHIERDCSALKCKLAGGDINPFSVGKLGNK
ncbi:MAG: hypothetical protein PHH68_00710 [Candidatus Omnitrophica bacterium]|jgi:carbonic anhydrase/acetyltransferase-like protein (isoleucine patch superfamily)|nr:hypothetical protein [Candidatus Omnitrophota bacterium]MDD5078829.1 hypothetical protein [Candidatus Omnitrophota bacterium]